MTTLSKEEIIAEANKEVTETSANRVTVLYADYGKRKTTTSCAMVQNHGLLLSSDDSWKVLLNERHKELYNKITVIKLEGISQLDYIDFAGYDTIIWDTVSQSVDSFLDLLYDKGKWPSKQGKQGYREEVVTSEAELAGLAILAPVDYRVTRDKIRPALNRLFTETDAHIIFTSQVTEPLPGLSKDLRARPSIPASTFKIIGTRADLIGYITPAGGSKFSINLAEDSVSFLAKSRIEGLQGKMDLDSFVAKYREIVFK